MVTFFNFSPTSNHLHPLQAENCDSNSRLVVDEDDNGKSGLKRLKHTSTLFSLSDQFILSWEWRVIVDQVGGGPRVVVSTAAFHARVRGSFPGLSDLKEIQMFLPHLLVKLSIVWSLRDREVACSASDLQGLNFESCVWRAVSSHSSHHPQEVLLAQFSLYVNKSGLKPDFICWSGTDQLSW